MGILPIETKSTSGLVRGVLSIFHANFNSDIMPGMERKMKSLQVVISALAQAAAAVATCVRSIPV